MAKGEKGSTNPDESRSDVGAGADRGASAKRVSVPPGPEVTIFGAGIAGLTAAHELVERGFHVQVVEPSESKTEEGCCEIGGVAATQWSFLSDPSLSYRKRSDPSVPMASILASGAAAGAPPVLVPLPEAPSFPYRIYFQGNDAAGTWAPAGYDAQFNLGAHMSPTPVPPERIENMVNATRLGLLEAAIVRFLDELNTPVTEQAPVIHVVGHAELTVTEGDARTQSLTWATEVSDMLTRHLTGYRVTFKPVGMGSSDPIGDNAFVEGRLRNNRVELHAAGAYVPGDHGYRFFPSFYRNLDDTLRRTPLYDAAGCETGESALSRLKGTPAVTIASNDGGDPFRLPRRRAKSFEELRAITNEMFRKLDYTAKDLALFQLQLFRFITMCPARRSASLDGLSWRDFVQGNETGEKLPKLHDCPRCGREIGHHHLLPFTDKFLEDLDKLPQAMAGMRAKESDAHTNGTITLQLLLDQLGDGIGVDRLLDGPTSWSWLAHWKHYLRRQGVRFFVGRLSGFERSPAPTQANPNPAVVGLLPIVEGIRGGASMPRVSPIPEPCFADEIAVGVRPQSPVPDPYRTTSSYYILALPVDVIRKHLLAAFPDPSTLDEPLRAIRGFTLGTAFDVPRDGPPTDTAPFRDVTGIQFYFAKAFHFAEGHIYHADSQWRLTSVSQLQFWRERRTTNSGYLSVISVDIGEMHEGDSSASALASLELAGVERTLADEARATPNPGLEALLDATRSTRGHAAALALRLRRYVAGLPLPGQNPPKPWATTKLLGTGLEARLAAGLVAVVNAIKLRFDAGTMPTPAELGALPAAIAVALGGPPPAPPSPLTKTDPVWVSWAATVVSLQKVVDAVTTAHVAVQGKHASRVLGSTMDCLHGPATIPFAWQSSRQEIAESVWRQIQVSLHEHLRGSIPKPNFFRIDKGIKFATAGGRSGLPNQNENPYFINAVEAKDVDGKVIRGFAARPGVLPGRNPAKDRFYGIAHEAWLPVGGVMKSHTRITSMEHANESGRHVVRSILHDDVVKKGESRGTMPKYWDPEEHEFEELAFLRRIDEILFEDERPHMVDILGLEEAVVRWMAGPGSERLDNLGDLLSAVRYQGNKDLAPWIEAMEKTSEPVRKLLEFLARIGVQSSLK